MIRHNLGRFFRTDTKDEALRALDEVNVNFCKCQQQLSRLPPLTIKYVLRVLGRAVDNPTLAAKLQNKRQRLDSDTISLLRINEGITPSQKAIQERIAVLEQYRKLRRAELGRFHCGFLRLIYQRYGKHPIDPAELRAFVSEACSLVGIQHPDPDKHQDRLDEWIATPIDPLDSGTLRAIHERAAQQAASRPIV